MSFPDLLALLTVLVVGVTLGVFLRRVDDRLQTLIDEQRATNELLARPQQLYRDEGGAYSMRRGSGGDPWL